MSKLIVLAGVPGSGKSFFSSLLKKIRRSHIYVVSSDELRNLVNGDQADLSQDKLIFDMFYELPKVYALDKDSIVLLDATHPNEVKRNEVIKPLIPLFDEVSLVMFKFDKEQVQTQNIEREHPVPQFVLDKFYEIFEDVGEIDKKTFNHIYVITDKTQLVTLVDRI